MTCSQCDKPIYMRGMCGGHYDKDYRARRKAAGGEGLRNLPSTCECGNFISKNRAACGRCIAVDNCASSVA
jgi:hypothetical protein